MQFSTVTDGCTQRIVSSEAAHMRSWIESMQQQFGPSLHRNQPYFGDRHSSFGRTAAETEEFQW